jgi:putative membrane protein
VTEQVVADRRLHPAAIVARTLRAIPEAAGGMVALWAVVARFDLGRIAMLALIGLAAAGALSFAGWWRFRYGVGAREIVIESGIMRRRRRVIPFERVQDIAIERGPLARLFGTAKVRIETGGSAADEGQLAAVSLAEAHRLRDILRGRLAGTPAAPTEPEEPVLFAMGLRRVLLSGLFNFSLVFIAFLFAAVQNAEQLGLADPKSILLPIELRFSGHWLVATILLLFAVLVLGLVAGIARTVARDFGFTLSRAPAGLRRRRGLFTLSETVIPLRRVQVAAIDGGFVARLLGWQGLAFQTLGTEGRGSTAQQAAPFANAAEIAPILAEAGIPDPGAVSEWRRSPRRAILHRALAPALLTLGSAAAGLLVEPFAFVPAGLFLLLALGAPIRWSRHGHALDGRALFMRDGALKRRIRIMPHSRLQTVSVRQGPLQRRLRLATVAVDTAGAPLRGLAVVDLDSGEADALAGRLVALFKDARPRRGTERARGPVR